MDNQENLLTCALDLFAARGYDAVGVKEIVDAAGVTKPTLYHYFGSKRGLLDAVLERHFAGLSTAVEKAATYRGDLPSTLNAVALAYLDYAREHPRFYRMQLAMWFAAPESDAYQAISRTIIRQQHLLETLFVHAAEDHGNMRGRHRSYAATFLGMLNTYIRLALNDYVAVDETLAYQAVHQFMHGIFS